MDCRIGGFFDTSPDAGSRVSRVNGHVDQAGTGIK